MCSKALGSHCCRVPVCWKLAGSLLDPSAVRDVNERDHGKSKADGVNRSDMEAAEVSEAIEAAPSVQVGMQKSMRWGQFRGLAVKNALLQVRAGRKGGEVATEGEHGLTECAVEEEGHKRLPALDTHPPSGAGGHGSGACRCITARVGGADVRPDPLPGVFPG